MANLIETSGGTYPAVRQIENGEPQAGGADGLWNEHAKKFIERSNWLKNAITSFGSYFPSGSGQNIDTVTEWARGLYNDANAGTWPITPTGRFWFVETMPMYTGALRQTATLYAGTGTPELDAYQRTKSNAGTWGPWRRIWQEGAAGADLNGNGYQRLPSGLLMQWGTTALFNATSTTITFPVAFPTRIFGVYPIHDGTEDRYYSWLKNGVSLSTALIYAHTGSAPVATTNKVTWYAIGN